MRLTRLFSACLQNEEGEITELGWGILEQTRKEYLDFLRLSFVHDYVIHGWRGYHACMQAVSMGSTGVNNRTHSDGIRDWVRQIEDGMSVRWPWVALLVALKMDTNVVYSCSEISSKHECFAYLMLWS